MTDFDPATDFNADARWRSTVSHSRPWSADTPSPLVQIPGAGTEQFLLRDIFHVCLLGVARTLCASLLCYLVLVGHFTPCNPSEGAGVPARLLEAYRQFRDYCTRVLQATPNIKHFTRENMNWQSTNKMPESTMKAADCRLLLRWLVDYLDGPLLLNDMLDFAFRAAAGKPGT